MAFSLPDAQILDLSPARVPGLEPLIGKDVILERLHTRHTEQLYDCIGRQTSLWNYVPSGAFDSFEDFGEYMDRIQRDELSVRYAAILRRTGKAVGLCGLTDSHLANRVTEVSVIYGAELQRTRAGSEILYLIMKLACEQLGYRRVEWRCHHLNAASRKAAERYGFVYEGTLRKHMVVKGGSRDTLVYSVVDEEWPAGRAVFETWLADENFDVEGNQKMSFDAVRNQVGERKGRWNPVRP